MRNLMIFAAAMVGAGVYMAGLIERLAAESIYVAPRLGRMRISPHVYNDGEDVDRFVAALRRVLG